jgi:hypothetical protein
MRASPMGPWRAIAGTTNGGRWKKIFAAKKMLAYAENSEESAGHGDTRDDLLRPSGLLGNT